MRDIDVDTLKKIESYKFNVRDDEEHKTKTKNETKFELFFFHYLMYFSSSFLLFT